MARETKYIDPATLPPHILQQYPLSSTHQGILYAPAPGQVSAAAASERGSGARTTSPMPPRDTTPPRASEERSSSVGSPWPPQHHMQPRPGHSQHSPGGSRPSEHSRHPTPPPRVPVIHRSITQGTVIMEPRVSEPSHLGNSSFKTLVDVAAKQQHVSVPGKERIPQLSPAPRSEPPKESRAEQMSKVH